MAPAIRATTTATPIATRRILPGTGRAEFAGMGNLLWLIIVILLILWLGGFAFHVGGGLIHILLVIAVIVLIFQLITGRRSI
jgi:hypothetical protein